MYTAIILLTSTTMCRINMNMNYVINRVLNIWNTLDYEIVNSQLFNCLNYCFIKLVLTNICQL